MKLQVWVRMATIGGIVVGVILPFAPLLLWSFGQKWWFPSLLPQEFTLKSWQYLNSPTSKIFEAFFNTLFIAVFVTLIAVVIGTPAARALGMYRFRGKKLLEILLLAPTIIPGLAVIMGLHVLFLRMGLADQLLGVILVHLIPSLPYFIIVLSGVFANYNQDYESQAKVLGARPWRVFWHVTLPIIKPGFVVGCLFVFLISWNQYILTLLIGGGSVLTLPVILFSFMSAGNYAIGAVVCLIYLAPAILIMIFTARYLTGQSVMLSKTGETL